MALSDLPKQRARLILLVLSKAGVFRKALPATGRVIVGRAEDCDIRIEDSKASRHHIAIDMGSDVQVTDLESRNGTMFGEGKLAPNQPAVLRLGAPLTIGSTVLMVQREPKELPTLPLLSTEAFAERVELERTVATRTNAGFALATIRFHLQGSVSGAVTLGETHGSTVGDEVVRAARLDRGLRELIRPGDVLAYVGPAEYRLLLAGATPEIAERIANRLRTGLQAHEVPADVGVASFPADGTTEPDLAAKSTAALRSRNQKEVAQPPLRPSALERLEPMIDRLAVGTINVLILGETGVGKEVLAHALHARSRRSTGPMLCLNCAALSETLLESELFGYERGAFTGAINAKPGLLESANGGTIFLDEVGEMPATVQARLLRVIEQREVTRLGAIKPKPIDVRVISATNRNLDLEITGGRFRQDLFFRLNGVVLTLPPLRERVDEIEPLAKEFAEGASKSIGRSKAPAFTREAITALQSYAWPGNIRELRNVVERAVLLADDDADITCEHLPLESMAQVLTSLPPTPSLPTGMLPRGHENNDERQRILAALDSCAGNQTRAAKVLGISRRTLVTRLKEYEVPRPRK